MYTPCYHTGSVPLPPWSQECQPSTKKQIQRDRRTCTRVSRFEEVPRKPDLKQVVRRVMQSHDKSSRSYIIGKPGEADENDGGHMVDDLFLEILKKKYRFQGTLSWPPAPTVSSTSLLEFPLSHNSSQSAQRSKGRLFISGIDFGP